MSEFVLVHKGVLVNQYNTAMDSLSLAKKDDTIPPTTDIKVVLQGGEFVVGP